MSESLQNMASSYVAKGRTVEFEKMSEYVDKLSEKIRTMEKIGQRIQKERTGTTALIFFSQSQLTSYFLRFQIRKAYLQDLQMVQPILNQWEAYEPNLSQGLQAIGEAANTCAEAQRKLVDCQKPSLSVVTGF